MEEIALLTPTHNGYAIRLIVSCLKIPHNCSREVINHVKNHNWPQKTQFIAEGYISRALPIESLYRIRLRVIARPKTKLDFSAARAGHLDKRLTPTPRQSPQKERAKKDRITCTWWVFAVAFANGARFHRDRTNVTVEHHNYAGREFQKSTLVFAMDRSNWNTCCSLSRRNFNFETRTSAVFANYQTVRLEQQESAGIVRVGQFSGVENFFRS